jgi:PAS domain S-box-containing protein
MADSTNRRSKGITERAGAGPSAARREEEILRQNEAKYRTLFESMRQGVFYQLADGTLVDVNPSALKMFGLSREELLGRTSYSPAWDVIREDGSPLPAEEHPSMLALTRGVAVKNVILAVRNPKINRYVWMSVNAIPQFRAGDTAPYQVMVTLHDITDLKQALEDVSHERNRAQRYLDIAEVMLVALDTKGRITLINRKGSGILGYKAGELLGKVWFETCLPERNRKLVRDVFDSLMSGDADFGEYAENPVLTKSGEERIIAWHNIVVRDDSGGIAGTFSSGEDITDRRRAEEALRQSEEQLRTAVDVAGLNAWIVQMETKDVRFIHMTSDFRGLAPKDPVPVEWALQFVHPEDRAPLISCLRRTSETGGVLRAECRVVMPDGTLRWIVSQGSWITGASGGPRRLFGVTLDMTERKRAEEAQLQAGKMEVLGTLASGIVHDFNNILLAIAGNAKLAITDLPPGHPVQENLAEIEKASARASSLVRRILSFSRPDVQSREVVQLAPVVEEALKFLRPTLPAMIGIRSSFADDVPPVACDTAQIQQVVINLAMNAAQAIGARSGLIDVGLDAVSVERGAVGAAGLPEGRWARLSVRDDGCGMDKATLERIFDPFFTTKPAELGTGLGLSIVLAIMKSHGGTVTVESEPGRGSAFMLYFPEAAEDMKNSREDRRELPRGRGEHVLFVDDEEAIIDLAVRMLERIGYQVTACADPARALGLFNLRPRDFDAVITDLAMPGMSGLELARALLAVRGDVPILLNSGNAPPDVREAAFRMGIREMIQKPETIDELSHALDRVFRALGRREGTAAGSDAS